MSELATPTWLSWNDELATGDERIDADHREILSRARRFVDSLGSAKEDEEVRATLAFLLEFVDAHFASEESLMEMLKYPHRDKHRLAHEALFRELSALMAFSRGAEAGLPRRVEAFLHGYFTSHFHAHDLPMAQFAATHRK